MPNPPEFSTAADSWFIPALDPPHRESESGLKHEAVFDYSLRNTLSPSFGENRNLSVQIL